MAESPRMISAARQEDDADASLRPKRLLDFIGQKSLCANLSVFIAAAKERKEPLDHVLLHGPPGLGKTTLAQIVARELGVGFRATSGPMIVKAGDLAAILTNLEANDVLFIDEIHTVIGAGATSGGAMDASNLLKPALSGGSIRCIGSTTYKEFRNHFEKDRALLRRFQKIDVSEPSIEETVKILQGLKSRFEEHHDVRYTQQALRSACCV